MAEYSDAYIVGRLIHQTRLLIATDDTIPVETKLQTQAMLKEFEAAVSVDEDEQDEAEVPQPVLFPVRRTPGVRRPRSPAVGDEEFYPLSVRSA